MAENMGRDRDLVLAPGEFAFVLDTTKGLVNTIVGPNKVSMSNTDQPVVWDKDKRRFSRCEVDKAIQINSIAPEGFYIALYNPADRYPRDGASEVTVPLKVGHRVNLPGPIQFSLWPGQRASVIQGHHLRSNQYLLAQVYNDAAATEHWPSAVVKPATGLPGDPPPPVVIEPKKFSPGQLLIIKGTEVAFFIPPTGIKVVAERPNVFVREAVTLERLEYCILLDEDGNKRFLRGPDVIFPEPTEKFIEKDGVRKFRAIELNETTGIYVKVIADYEEAGKSYKAGDELFITGKEQAIYFQREEHSVIRYGEQTKHYAVAIPAGEGRYVLNRSTGVISLELGPRMLLCDPRNEVITRRMLSEKEAKLWYPGNAEVIAINQALAKDALSEPTQYQAGRAMTANYMALNMRDEQAMTQSRQFAGDTFTRGNTFTPPRTITLDTKYEGAVAISVWSGYAVMIVDKTDKRRVVVGPATTLLQYDESLTPLQLSTGQPKRDTPLFHTAYLRVQNNRVSDVITVETKDLVPVRLNLSYRVNFEGDPTRWFAVENYVQLLCDHMRSLIRNAAKSKGVEEFYAQAIDIVRQTILGAPTTLPVGGGSGRPGRVFDENGMRVYDVEVLDVSITDQTVATLLTTAQLTPLRSVLQIAEATTRAETAIQLSELAVKEIGAQETTTLARLTSEAAVKDKQFTNAAKNEAALDAEHASTLARDKATSDQQLAVKTAQIKLELERMLGETKEITARATAVSPSLAAALTTFSDQALVEKISTALAPMAAMNGVSAADVLAKLFAGTPFEGVMKTLGTRSRMPMDTKS